MLKIQDIQSRMSLLIYMMQRIRLLVILLRLEERSLQWKRYGHFISKRNSSVTTIYTKISTLLHYPEITPEGEFSSSCNSSNQGFVQFYSAWYTQNYYRTIHTKKWFCTFNFGILSHAGCFSIFNKLCPIHGNKKSHIEGKTIEYDEETS